MSSARGRSRLRGGDDDDHVNHERWLISYSDMITVLMALFIVLYAISQVDQVKFNALRQSLAAGFGDGTVSQSVLDGTDGALDGISATTERPDEGTAGIVSADDGLGMQASQPTTAIDPSAVDPAVLAAAEAELAHLDDVRAQIMAVLTANGLGDAVRFRIDERGLVMGLVADDVFFAPASAELTATARQVLDLASPTILALGEQISIEGHANVIPVSGRYPTNWELSSDRATQVLRHLVEVDGLPGARAMAVGFGDTRPLVEGSAADALTANRRVDLVILSDAPESVRALLPAVDSQSGTGS